MATTPAPNLTLTAKQQSVLLNLWPCLKSPPHIDIQIGPAGIRLGATFDTTAHGMVFETVRSDNNQVSIAANLDVTAVEVDFERLKAAAGLNSVEEAAEIWESIKHVVDSAAAATPVSHRSSDVLKVEDRWWELPKWEVPRQTLLEQLCTAARDLRLVAFKIELRKLESQLEDAVEGTAGTLARSEQRGRYTNDRLEAARNDVRRAPSTLNMKHARALTAWFTQGLFGEKGLENLYSSQRERIQRQSTEEHIVPQRDLSMTLTSKVLDTYKRIYNTAGAAYGQAYQDRLRLYVCFYDQLTSLRHKFWQKGSEEQRELLRYWEDKGLSALPGRTDWNPRSSMQQIAWVWLTEKTGQSRSSIDDAEWKGRQFRTMIELFGDGVLYFMDSHLEAE